MKTAAVGSISAAATLALGLAAPAFADTPKPIQAADHVTVTATVEAIDHTSRHVTLKGEKGNLVTIAVPPDVERFDAIKIGDVVKAQYIESIVVRLAQPGDDTADASVEAGLTQRAGDKPGATIANQVNVKVKVLAIDKAGSSLTIETPSGDKLSTKVKDKKRLEKLKVGDQIDVTYTEALLLTVDPQKK